MDTVLDVTLDTCGIYLDIKSRTFSVVLASYINLVCSGTLNFFLINVETLILSTGSHYVKSFSYMRIYIGLQNRLESFGTTRIDYKCCP